MCSCVNSDTHTRHCITHLFKRNAHILHNTHASLNEQGTSKTQPGTYVVSHIIIQLKVNIATGQFKLNAAMERISLSHLMYTAPSESTDSEIP